MKRRLMGFFCLIVFFVCFFLGGGSWGVLATSLSGPPSRWRAGVVRDTQGDGGSGGVAGDNPRLCDGLHGGCAKVVAGDPAQANMQVVSAGCMYRFVTHCHGNVALALDKPTISLAQL